MPAAHERFAESGDVRKLPRLVTSIQPLNLSAGLESGLPYRSLPSRQAMEELSKILSNSMSHARNISQTAPLLQRE